MAAISPSFFALLTECPGELTSRLSQWGKSLLFKDTLDHIASGNVPLVIKLCVAWLYMQLPLQFFCFWFHELLKSQDWSTSVFFKQFHYIIKRKYYEPIKWSPKGKLFGFFFVKFSQRNPLRKCNGDQWGEFLICGYWGSTEGIIVRTIIVGLCV